MKNINLEKIICHTKLKVGDLIFYKLKDDLTNQFDNSFVITEKDVINKKITILVGNRKRTVILAFIDLFRVADLLKEI